MTGNFEKESATARSAQAFVLLAAGGGRLGGRVPGVLSINSTETEKAVKSGHSSAAVTHHRPPPATGGGQSQFPTGVGGEGEGRGALARKFQVASFQVTRGRLLILDPWPLVLVRCAHMRSPNIWRSNLTALARVRAPATNLHRIK